MLLPRMRFTVRGLMIAIAVMAIALGVGIEVMRLKRFRDQFLAKAKEHEAWAAMYSNWEEHEHRMAAIEQEFAARWSKHLDRQKRLVDKSRSPEIEDRVDESTKRLRTFAEARERDALEARSRLVKFANYAAYHAALKQKYLRASERPWRSVEPDPPPPEPTARGDYWIAHGDYQQALAGYEQAVGDEPENSDSLNNLAWLLSTCPDAVSVAVGEGTTLAANWALGCYRWFAVDWRPASWLGIQPE